MTKKVYLDSVALSILTYAAVVENQALEASGSLTPATDTVTLAAAESSVAAFGFASEAGFPNDADWPSGDYVAVISVNAIGADITLDLGGLGGAHFNRLTSTTTSAEALNNTGNYGSWDSRSGTGLKTFTLTGDDPGAGSSTDRIGFIIEASNAATMKAQDITLNLGTTATYIEGPWTVGPADQNVSPGAIALSLGRPAPEVRPNQLVSPAAAARALVAVAPTVQMAAQEVSPAAIARILAGVAPRVDQAVAPAAAARALVPVAPTVQASQLVSPAAAARTLTPVAPRIDQAVAPAALARLLVAVAPTAFARAVHPAAIALSLARPGPRIDQEVRAVAIARVLTAIAPVINVSGGGQTVSPGALALAIAAIAPGRVDQRTNPAALALALGRPSPAVQASQIVSPPALARAIAIIAPRLDREVRPAALARALVPVAPARIDQRLQLTALALAILAIAPTLGEVFPPDAVATFIAQAVAIAEIVEQASIEASVTLSPTGAVIVKQEIAGAGVLQSEPPSAEVEES